LETKAAATASICGHLALFVALFEDKTTLPEDVAGIAGTLIRAAPSDAAMIHKILSFAEQKPDVHVTIAEANGLKQC
jgi:hypothetical protein